MDADVVIVGAGPVGLLLASELRLAGIRPLLLERLTAPTEQPKARGIGVLAAEALRRRGLGEALDREHQRGLLKLEREHGTTRGHFAWIHKLDVEEGRQGALIGQPALERLLREHCGVEVRYGHTVTGWADGPDEVTLTVETAGGAERITAGFVVGCDGGHSTVRKLAGFDFPGTPPLMTVRYAAADVVEPERLPPAGRLPGGTLFHDGGMIATFDFTPGDTSSGPLTVGEVRESVRRVSGVEVDLAEFRGGLRFTDQARQAATYRRGRTLLAGDAAHVHSPSGGQGLNLGLMDAMNLGWKLAATVRGDAPEGLLDTYTAERHPVGAAVLHNTRAQSALLAPGAHVDALRDVMSDLMNLPEVNRHLSRLLSGVTHRYRLPYAADHPAAGTHCPPLTIDGTTPLNDLTTTGRTLLLHPDAKRIDTGPRAEAVPIESLSDDRLAAVLIRPDGVLAWAAAPGDDLQPASLREALVHW
jgi:2-polyprenyl-6-methoxyphenol hydroxylase-like FAD-dependent oxidoreductase